MLNPLGEAPDEADHYAYAAYIGQHGSLPTGPEVTQSKHPPLYYALAAAVSSWTGMDFSFLRSNPDGGVLPDQSPNFFIHTRLEAWPWRGGALAMHLGRLLSILAGLVLTLTTYGLGRRIWPARPAIALAGAALVAFLPESLFVGASMTNDMLAAMLAGLALWLSLDEAREEGARAYLVPILTGVCLGLAFLTKVSTVALWPVALLAMLLQGRRVDGIRMVRGQNPAINGLAERAKPGEPGWGNLYRAVIAGFVALALAAPWLYRNLVLYGDPLGTALARATVDQRQGPLGPADLVWLLRGWFFSFFGKFGGAGHIALAWPFYVLWAVLLLGAGAGWVSAWLGSRRGQGSPLATTPSGGVVLWASPVLAALSIVSYSAIALGTDQGRLLFPALAPLGLLIAGGLAAWWPERTESAFVPTSSVLLGVVAVLALITGIVIPFAPPPEPSPARLAEAQATGRVFDGTVELAALSWEHADPEMAGDGAGLTLYWQARRPTTDDLRTNLRVIGADGAILWEAKRSPGAGRFSTDRWPPGRLIADSYTLPPDLLAKANRVELGLRPFPEGPWLPLDGGGDALALEGWEP